MSNSLRGPRENRQDSYARAARASQMRLTGATWERIASQEGYRSRRAAQLAVERHRKRCPTGNLEDLRFDANGGYELVKSFMFGAMSDARARGNIPETIAAARALTDTIDKQCRLLGLNIPVAQQVDVTVTQSAAEIIESTRQRLLSLVSDTNVIEGEVIA